MNSKTGGAVMATTQADVKQNRVARALERRLGRRYQQFVFWRAMRRFMRDLPQTSQGFDTQLLSELVSGWGNSWSAQHEYLSACLEHVRDSDGPVLECGSGLSTILAGAVAQQRGIRIWSLEHDAKWAVRTQNYLHKYRINSVTVSLAPIRSYGDFDWYSLPSLQAIPGKIALVICDGPPGGTRGGRYGLVPVMLDKLRPDCTILLDDGARDDERAIGARWGQMLATNPELIGKEKPFIRLRAGRTVQEPMHT
jgi:hypothetical protein